MTVNIFSETPEETGPYNCIETASHRLGRKEADKELNTPDVMALAHNTYIRGLNACIAQAHGVHEREDIKGLVEFALMFKASLDHHHQTEEEHFFAPLEELLNAPGRMGHNIEQHRGFHIPGVQFQAYCQKVFDNPEEWNADELVEKARKFGDPLVEHLHEEIDDLLDLKLSGLDPHLSVTNKQFNVWEQFIIKTYDPSIFGPYGMCCNDHNYEQGMHTWWPPLPLGARTLIKYWYSGEHSNAWRFAPCKDETPRPLPFVEHETDDNVGA